MYHNAFAQMFGLAPPYAQNHPPRADATKIPAEVLFARDFVNEHQVMARPIPCHCGDCGYITPDTMLGQEFAVGAAHDLIYGYFVRAQQNLRYPSPLDDPDDDEEDDDDLDEEPLRA